MAPTLEATPNYSLLSIPAYFVLVHIPHVYSLLLLRKYSRASAGTVNTGGGSGGGDNSGAQSTSTPSRSSSSSQKSRKGTIYNTPNPRSSLNAQRYSDILPRTAYARYERARAAHTNMIENSGFFLSAILAGVVTRCDAAFMNKMAALYLASRLAYLVSYISVSRGSLARLRTVWFVVGVAVQVALWWEASKILLHETH